MIIGEIGKITAIQQNLVMNLNGTQPVLNQESLNRDSTMAYVTFRDFVKYQKDNEIAIKSMKYELERLRSIVTKRSNPL